MERVVNIGVIGAGAFMARQHLPNMLRNPAIRLHTLCDLNEELLRTRREEFHPQVCTTREDDVFTCPEIGVVMIGTRSAQHACFIEKAARHGKHVFVEKPMTMSLEETQRVLESVRSSGITVGVGFNRRFAPSMIEAKRLFNEYRQGPAHVIYRIVDDHEVRPAYIFALKEGGGHLLQEGCHIFDLLSWFLDREPVEVYCAGRLEADNMLLLKFADDSLATIVCGGKGGVFYPKECMEVFCNRTTLVMDHFFELRMDGPKGNLIKRFPLDRKSASALHDNTMTGLYDAHFAMRPPHDLVGAHAANKYFTLAPDKGHDGEIRAFADTIVRGTLFAPGVVDGARATVCALKAYESIRRNQPVSISPAEYGK
jgi:predicted dehydrogenase